MNEGLHLYSVLSRTAALALNALPNAPVVEERKSERAAPTRSVRLATSRLLRWLADALEPGSEPTFGSPGNSATAC